MRLALHLTLLLLLAGLAHAGEAVLVFTNDVHGRHAPRDLMGSEQSGGAPAMAAALAELRAGLAEDQELVLVDSGDFLFGEGRAAQLKGIPAIRLMNALGYAVVGLGNHEFDMGWGTLSARAREARFPFLAANVFRRDHVAPRGIHPSRLVILKKAGLRLGFVGIAPEDGVATGPYSRNKGLRFGDAAEAVTREVDRLRGQGADLVIILSHQGLAADQEMLRDCPCAEVDLVVGGHHPSERVDTALGRTRILQAAGEGEEFGVIRLRPGKDTTQAPVQWIPWATRRASAGDLAEHLAPYQAPEPVLATAPQRWTMERTGEWVIGAMAAAARAQGREPEVTILNRRALRAALARGPVTPATLRRIAPFDNHLVELDMSARQLRRVLAEGRTREGRRGLLVLGEAPLRGRVKVLVNDYLAEGGDGFEALGRVRRREVLAATVREAMRESLPEAVEGPAQ
jgi:2',3'-cyclic-nucleotide 2'-phosphodiesterase (5'-nucleotidase family)